MEEHRETEEEVVQRLAKDQPGDATLVEDNELLIPRQSFRSAKDDFSIKTVSEESYDPDGKKKKTNRSTTLQATFNMFRSIVGTTFLAIPFLCELVG